MTLIVEQDSYYRSGAKIVRRPEAGRSCGEMANIVTSRFCKVCGLDKDPDGVVFPDYYTGFMYTFPEQNGGDSEAYLFLASHDPDEEFTIEDMLENVHRFTQRLVFHKPKTVSVKVNSNRTFEVFNKDQLEAYELFAIDVMFNKHGLRRA